MIESCLSQAQEGTGVLYRGVPTPAVGNAKPGLPSGITLGYDEGGLEGARRRAGRPFRVWGVRQSPGELELGPEPGWRQWDSKATAAGGPKEPRREG